MPNVQGIKKMSKCERILISCLTFFLTFTIRESKICIYTQVYRGLSGEKKVDGRNCKRLAMSIVIIVNLFGSVKNLVLPRNFFYSEEKKTS